MRWRARPRQAPGAPETVRRLARPVRADPAASRRWRERRWFARLVRAVVFLIPLVASFCVALWLSSVVPMPEPRAARIARWLAIAVASTLVLIPLQRLMRRFLPLSALFSLTLVFPDEAPSRFRIALRSFSVRDLQRWLDGAAAAPADEPPREAAERLLVLVAALSRHDRLTRGHSERVRAYTIMIAEEMGLDADQIDRLRWAGLLHDIGKLHVPAAILTKPGTLTGEEFEVIKTHPLRGAELAAPLRDWLGDDALAVLQHHEQWTGGGYPFGLVGEEISLAGRLVSVADAFDVMTATRSYKTSMPPQQARAELERCAGTQFDPTIVRAMLSISLGRLWRAMGPLSWVAQFKLFPRQAAQGGTVVATSVAAAVSVALTAMAAGVAEPDHGATRTAEPAVTTTVEVASEAPAPRPVDPPPAAAPAADDIAPAATDALTTTSEPETSAPTTELTLPPPLTLPPYTPVYVPVSTVAVATATTRPATTTSAAPTTTATTTTEAPTTAAPTTADSTTTSTTVLASEGPPPTPRSHR